MRITTRMIILTISIVFCFIGCRKSPKLNKKHTLTIGGILSLTGGAAAYGEESNRGIQIALDEIEADGIITVNYLSRDSQSKKAKARSLAQTLIVYNKVNAILGPTTSPNAMDVGRLAETYGVPMIITSATKTDLTNPNGKDRTFVSRVCFSDDFQSQLLAKFAINELKLSTVAVIYDRSIDYSVALTESFSLEYEKLGGKVAYKENFSLKTEDFSVLVDKVSSFDADLLFIAGWDSNIGPMLKQAGRKWDDFTILGADGCPTPTLLELAQGNTLNTYAVSHFQISKNPRLMVRKFADSYKKKYGKAPAPFAALGYDAMMLLYDAAKRAKTFNGEDLRDAINSSSGLELVSTPSLRWDGHRNPIKSAYMVKVNPDGFAFYKVVQP